METIIYAYFFGSFISGIDQAGGHQSESAGTPYLAHGRQNKHMEFSFTQLEFKNLFNVY